MCGITGFFSKEKRIPEEVLEIMTSTLAHRGPENQSHYFHHHIGLGHRRLKIIDLSNEANQPMTSGSGRYIIVYNGEIYNFRELKAKYSISTKTQSDTEVILEAFEKTGPFLLQELNGMFAMAIYDTLEDSLFLARDRMGIKPLFYFFDGKNLAFASEIKALLTIPMARNQKETDYTSIARYLHLGYIPEPHTIYKNIFKFPSGSYGIFSNDSLRIQSFWKTSDHIAKEKHSDFQGVKNELKALVEKSVKYRLISDVPYGTFLSGGIDSSLVTAVAQSLTSENISTFSIGFKESKFNESEYAQKVAKHLNTNHHEFIVSHNDAKELIEKILEAYDEPYADTSAIPTMLVSKMARAHVTMTLSGDGGDELFHGYGAYIWANRLHNPWVQSIRKPIRYVLQNFSNRYKRAAHLFDFDNTDQLESHIFSQEQYYFSQQEISSILKTEAEPFGSLDFFNPERGLTAAEKQAIFDLNYYLKDDLLVKVDRASMKYSLEDRVPLLDHHIVEFALNIDPRLKMYQGTQKYILKEVLFDYLPKAYFERPKWGFGIPLIEWLKTDLKYLIDRYLDRKLVEESGVIHPSFSETLKQKYLSGRYDYLYNRVWQLIQLHQFLIRNK